MCTYLLCVYLWIRMKCNINVIIAVVETMAMIGDPLHDPYSGGLLMNVKMTGSRHVEYHVNRI